MKKIFGLLLCIVGISMSSSVSAQNAIEFHTPRAAIGGSFLLSNGVVSQLKQKGWEVDFKALDNCALAKSRLETTNTPLVTMLENVFMAEAKTEACHMPPPKPEEIVAVHVVSPYYVCVAKNSTITPEDLLKSNKPYTMAAYNDVLQPQVVSKLQKSNPNLKVIYFKDTRTAFFAGETDAYLGAHGAAMMKDNKAICFFNTSTKTLNGTEPLGKFLGDASYSKELYYFTVAKNLTPEQMQKLRSDVKEIMATEEWKKTSARYLVPTVTDPKEFNKLLQNYVE